LTAGELGAAAAQTVMVALLPVLLAPFAPSAVWIGFAIGGEGIFALLLPFWVGALSDRLPKRVARRFGRRTFFLLIAAPLIAGALVVVPWLHGYWPLAGAAFVCFAALHAYLTPFWTLLVDAVPEERRGRVQGVRGFFRAAGLAYGLVAAGLLYSIWRPLPFLLAAALVLATTAATARAERSFRAAEEPTRRERLLDAWKEVAARPGAAALLLAEALWNAAIDGIRPYLFLYTKNVLGASVAETSLGLALLVAGLALGSVYAGRLADRYGRARVLSAGSALLAAGMAAGFFARSFPVALAVLAVAGLGAAAELALPYPLFAELMGEDTGGEHTGIYVVSYSLGRILAPLLVGGAVDLGALALPGSHGYPFMWLVAGLFAAGGWGALQRSRRAVRRAGGEGARRGNMRASARP
jgi:MFS family permease